jgi:hypothetical protein
MNKPRYGETAYQVALLHKFDDITKTLLEYGVVAEESVLVSLAWETGSFSLVDEDQFRFFSDQIW